MNQISNGNENASSTSSTDNCYFFLQLVSAFPVRDDNLMRITVMFCV